MAWNEPGNGQQGPWGRKRAHPGGKHGLDERLRWLRKHLGASPGGGLIGLVAALLLLWFLVGSYTVIGPAQSGVVLRLGQYARTLPAGFHFKLPPPLETVTKVETTRVRSSSDSVRMLTQDENIIVIDFTVQYQVQDARHFLFSLDDPENTVRAAAESAVRAVLGRSTMDQILSGAGALRVFDARELLQQTLDGYHSGIHIAELSFQNVAPPKEVKDAFDDVNKAREDKQSAENNAQAYASKMIPLARGEAARIEAEAEGDRAERIARAQGDAERFNLILKEYRAAPEVTRKRLWLETMEQVLSRNTKIIDGSGGRNLINLPAGAVPAAKLAPAAAAVEDGKVPVSTGKEMQP